MTDSTLFPDALWRLAWRSLRRNPWQSALMVLGVALGVAVIVAIDVANASASRAFSISAETLTGRATHQVTGTLQGQPGLDESVYAALRKQGLGVALAPVVSAYVDSPDLGSQPLQLLGIDPFADAPFRDYLGAGGQPDLAALTSLLTRPGAVLLSSDLAARYNLRPGSAIRLRSAGYTRPALVVGLLTPSDALSRRALAGMVIADISSAQELLGRAGRIDRIDLILPETNRAALESQLRAFLPTGAVLEPAAARTNTLEQMTAAFRINLTALSLLALVVGLFLIYNTMTFSIVQRRELFGMIRSLGVTRREVFGLVLVEAFSVGVLGSLGGIGLGLWLSQATVRAILQTINDLYFTLTVSQVGIPLESLAKGALAGLAATVFGALVPAWEASTVSPIRALASSQVEEKVRSAIVWAAAAGLACLALGAGIFALPLRDILSGFGGTLTAVLGCAFLAPFCLQQLLRLAAPVTARLFGVTGKLAPRSLEKSLSRSAVAVTALMIAVAVTIGVNVMIASFRGTVVAWLGQSLQGDIYLTAPAYTSTAASVPIDPAVDPIVAQWPGAVRVDHLRTVLLPFEGGTLQVNATDNITVGRERIFLAQDVPSERIRERLLAGDVIVSEPLANRLHLPMHGAILTLQTPAGPRAFPVAGIHYDYSSSQGMVTMALETYRSIWPDAAITAISLRLQPGADDDAAVTDLRSRLGGIGQQLIIRPNSALRADALQVFDRTFAITGALQLLATVVAFIGVLNSLLMQQLEKKREIGILRAIGLTGRQMWGLVMLETGLMGAAAGLLAMPTGYLLSVILIYIINRRSFGWTLQLEAGPLPFLQALGVALTAALLAGILPARRLSRMSAAEAIRNE